jgi:hypothetical protein
MKEKVFNFANQAWTTAKQHLESAINSSKGKASEFTGQAWIFAKTHPGSVIIGAGATYLFNKLERYEALEQAKRELQDSKEEITHLKTINAESEIYKIHMAQRNDFLIDRLILGNERINDCMHNRDAMQNAYLNSFCLWRQHPVDQINSTSRIQETNINSKHENIQK